MERKKQLYFLSCALIFVSFVVLMISSASNISLLTSLNSVSSLPNVVVDAGHGGEDGGAVNDEGVLEKNINLDISNDTADLLSLLGFSVTKTRSEDVSLSSDEATVRARKVADLKKRLEIFNSSENNVVLSIHQNKFNESKYHGTQIFYSPNALESQKLAESVKYSVKEFLQPENERECKKADSSIYILKNCKNPAVIVECGFISNYEECQKLLNEDYQKQMAFSISTGLLSYLNKL